MGDTSPEAAWRSVEPAAASALGVRRLTDPRDLGGSPRTHVWRCSDGTTSYVVKAYLEPDNTNAAREAAGLEALAGGVAVPRLLASADEPPLVVMADLGTGSSLADLLLGTDRSAAEQGLDGWIDALARLHAASTPGVLAAFERNLSARTTGAVGPDYTGEHMAAAAAMYADLAPGVGVQPGAALDEMVALLERLSGERVMTPGDTCPDNNLVAPDGTVTLLDLEGAAARHPAWDLAYLRVPWPSCWCAWQVPAETAAAAVARYREQAGTPWAAGPSFAADLDAATLGWCLLSSAWFLSGALEGGDGASPGKPRPGRRTLVLHRLALATTLPGSDVLRDFASRLHAALLARWGEHPLALAPAFADAAPATTGAT